MDPVYYRGYYIVTYNQWDEVDIYDKNRLEHLHEAKSLDEAKKVIDEWLNAR